MDVGGNKRIRRRKKKKFLNSRLFQTALEYMLTYGWAVLIIVLISAVLYTFGFFSPASSISSTVTGFSSLGSVNVQCVNNIGVIMTLGDSSGVTINITDINVSSNGHIYEIFPNSEIYTGQKSLFIVPGDSICPANSRYAVSTTVQYTEPGQPLPGPRDSNGYATGPVVYSKIKLPSTVTLNTSTGKETIHPVGAVEINITNSQNVSTPPVFQDMLNFDSNEYSFYEAPNLQNVFFFYGNGSILDSWMQSGNTNTNSSTVYWLRIPGIPAHSSEMIFMGFADKSINVLNNKTTGEAPDLSPLQGEYDDGQTVFSAYGNFLYTSSLDGWTPKNFSGSYVPAPTADGVKMINKTVSGSYIYPRFVSAPPEPTIISEEWYYNGAADANSMSLFGNDTNIINANIVGDTCGPALPVMVYSVFSQFEYVSGHGCPPSETYLKQSITNSTVSSLPFGGFGPHYVYSFLAATGGGKIETGYIINKTFNIDNISNIVVSPDNITSGVVNVPSIFNYRSLTIGAASFVPSYEYIQWVVERAYPPNGIMPSAQIG